MRRVARFYGTNPLHLLAMVFCLALVLQVAMVALSGVAYAMRLGLPRHVARSAGTLAATAPV